MTANQIAYNNYVETKRHQQAVESETQRHNEKMEKLEARNITEQSIRHTQSIVAGLSQQRMQNVTNLSVARINAANQLRIGAERNSAAVMQTQLAGLYSTQNARTNAEAQMFASRLAATTNERVANINADSRLQTTLLSTRSNAAINSANRAMQEKALSENIKAGYVTSLIQAGSQIFGSAARAAATYAR